MSSHQRPITLILGGTGQLGSLVAESLLELKDRAVQIRVVTRNKEDIQELKQKYDDCVYMDFDDPRTYEEAFQNVDRVFLLTGYTFHMVRQAKALVDQCKKSGVKFIVHNGVYTPEPSSVPYFAWHELIEAYIQASGIPYTFLHPNYFLHNLIGVYHLARNGKITCHFGDKKIGCVALEDVAEAAARILNEGPEKHRNQNYWFSTELLNVFDMANTISEVCGKKFEAIAKTPKDFADEITEHGQKKDVDPYMLSAIEFHEQIVDGRLTNISVVKDDFPKLIGKKGMKLREWAELHKDDLLKA